MIRKHLVPLVITLVMLVFCATIGGLIVLTQYALTHFGTVAERRILQAVIPVTFFGTVQAFFVVVSFLEFWLRAKLAGETTSTLIGPIIGVKVGIAGLGAIATIRIFAAILSVPRAARTLPPLPALQLVEAIAWCGVVVVMTWFHLSFLRAWGVSRPGIIGRVALMVSVSVGTTLALFVAIARV